MRPTAKRIALVLIASLSGFAHAQEDYSESQSKITVDEIVARLHRVERRLKNFSVSSHAVCHYKFAEPGVEPDQAALVDGAVASKQVTEARWCFGSDGSGRYEAITAVSNIRFDGSTGEKQRIFLSTFDGTSRRGRHIITALEDDGSWDGEERIESRFVRGLKKPSAYITEPAPNLRFSQILENQDARIIATRTWQGRELLVLQTRKPADDAPNYQSYFQFWFDPQKGAIVRMMGYGRRRIGMPWYLASQHQCLEYEYHREVDLWLPTEVHAWNWVLTDAGSRFCSLEEHLTFTDWMFKQTFDDKFFSAFDSLEPLLLTKE